MTSDDTLDERYFDWLYSKIGLLRNSNPARSFWLLAEQLHNKRFEWAVPNDDNRTEEGKTLRDEFLNDFEVECDYIWIVQDCSVLEMMIALSRRIEFETSHDAFYWFWKMIENLSLREYTDDTYDDEVTMIVDKAITAVIDRQYRKNGSGGLFPLKHPHEDQREVELWFQMSLYLLENGYE